jgi:N-acetylglucosamine-6-phosphate deacetylase
MITVTGEIVTSDGVLSGAALTIDEETGLIAEIASRSSGVAKSGDIDAGGYWVLPGFIDMHVHGGGGADFMHGTTDAVRTAARTHARFGTTGLLATTLTASRADTDAAIRAAREVMEMGRGNDEARIIGVHLEGPYICPARRGAQPEAHVRLPDLEEFTHWVEIGGGAIREITLAPEMEGAEAVTRAALAANVVVSAGHTDSRAADVARAIPWGVRQGTHLFNAMRGVHHREPGTAGAILVSPEIVAEVIADGVHLHPEIVRLTITAKGLDGVVLITDAMEGAAMPDGVYKLGGFDVNVQNGEATFADGTLAGSVLTMDRAFHNTLKFAQLAPWQGARLSSANAARQLGILDRVGTLEPGKQGDLVVMDPETGRVEWTVIGGRVAYRR